MSTLMASIKPDLVMLQVGVNDVWGLSLDGVSKYFRGG